VTEYNGGCEDWLEQFEARKAAEALTAKAPAPVAKSTEPTAVAKLARKLTNKEREALQALPAKIKQLEAEHAALSEKMASAKYYQDQSSDMAGDAKRLEQLEADTIAAYEQFEALTGEG